MEEKNNKRNNIYKNLMIVIITALITCIITTIVVYNYANTSVNGTTSGNVLGNLTNSIISSFSGDKNNISIDKKIADIKKKLEEIYIGEIDDEKLIESALEGYVSGLGDEYTEYLTQEEVTSIMEDVNGSYVGVGLYIAQNAETNEILVVGVIEDSPANKAGILVGDVVEKGQMLVVYDTEDFERNVEQARLQAEAL